MATGSNQQIQAQASSKNLPVLQRVLVAHDTIKTCSTMAFSEMPRVSDEQADVIAADLATLERGLAPSDPKAWAAVLGRLACLPSRSMAVLDRQGKAMMLADMAEALCRSIPQDLIETTRQRAMERCTFFPAPAELIALVKPEITERTIMRNTARMMLMKAGRTAQ